jgi:ATP synthase protein I
MLPLKVGCKRMPLTFRIVIAQIIAVSAVAVGMSLVGIDQVHSALMGGVVSVTPTAWFAWRAGRTRVGTALVAQGAMKSVGTMLAMVLVFALFRPAPLGFFVAIVAAQLMYVLVPLRGDRGENKVIETR